MYAIIETGGKQYKVAEGDVITIEKLDVLPGNPVSFDRVLAVHKNNGELVVGTPVVAGAQVDGTVLDQGKHRKILVFKYKAKSNYRRRYGHRQPYSKVRIEAIKA